MPTGPSNVAYGRSGESFRLPIGAPVYQDVNGLYRLASSADLAKCPAVGVVYQTSTQNPTIAIINSSYLMQGSWLAVIGTSQLTSGAVYYLSTTPGRLTTNSSEPGSLLTQPVGKATSPITMQLLGNAAFTPPTGATVTLNAIEATSYDYWTLDFQNGLIASATHHTGTGPPSGGGGSPNLDGGEADSNYGAISPVDGGTA